MDVLWGLVGERPADRDQPHVPVPCCHHKEKPDHVDQICGDRKSLSARLKLKVHYDLEESKEASSGVLFSLTNRLTDQASLFKNLLCSPVKGSMLEGKRYSTMARSQSGILGSLGSLGSFTGCPRSSNWNPTSTSSSATAAAASSFFSSPAGGGGGGGGALAGAVEIRHQDINEMVLHWCPRQRQKLKTQRQEDRNIKDSYRLWDSPPRTRQGPPAVLSGALFDL